MKRCATLPIIREMQTKKLKYHLTPVRIATIKKTTDNKYFVEKRKPVYMVGENIGKLAASMEKNSIEVPQKTKNRTII